MRYLLLLVILCLQGMPVRAEVILCDGATGEISFLKAKDNEIAFAISIRRSDREVTKQHAPQGRMSLECISTARGRKLFEVSASYGGSHSPEYYELIDAGTLATLVPYRAGNYRDVEKILGESPTTLDRKSVELDEAQARVFPERTGSKLFVATKKLDAGDIAEAIDILLDLAKKGNAKAADLLGSMYGGALRKSDAEYWCNEAARSSGARCTRIIARAKARENNEETYETRTTLVPTASSYTDIKDAILDSNNAVGKLIHLDAKFTELGTRRGRPTMLVNANTETSLTQWRVFFDTRHTAKVRELKKGQRISLECRILDLNNMVSLCELE